MLKMLPFMFNIMLSSIIKISKTISETLQEITCFNSEINKRVLFMPHPVSSNKWVTE